MPFSNLTVVSVTGADAYAEGSMWALIRSCEELPGAKGLLISPTCPANMPDSGVITHKPCHPFGYLEYSLFMIYNLAQYIETDYCLVVQSDGWVLDGKNWRDEFWDYDYIGAPVTANFEIYQNDSEQRYIRVDRKASSIHSSLFMQNGGFSFRSKRLLELPRELGLQVPVSPTKVANPAETFRMGWEGGDNFPTHNEDLYLYMLARPHLEKAGMQFAPFEVANRFAYGNLDGPFITKTSLDDIFGHHLFHKTEITGYNSVQAKVPEIYFPNGQLSQSVVKLFAPLINRGYYVNVTSV